MAPIRVGALEPVVYTVGPFYSVNQLEKNFQQAESVEQHLATSKQNPLVGDERSLSPALKLAKNLYLLGLDLFSTPSSHTSIYSSHTSSPSFHFSTNDILSSRNTSKVSQALSESLSISSSSFSHESPLPTASASVLSGPRAAAVAEQAWLSERILLTMIGALLFCLILATIFGNLFVIWAVCVERTLRTVGNYLVFSLAITDLLVACLVMPFGAHYVISQEWRLGVYMCELWSFLDVLCCTASIFHLLAIACDRYWAVTSVDYIHRRKAIHVCAAIASIWALSAVVSLGPFLGWKDEAFEWRIVELKQCLVSQSITYQVFATFVSFYGPSGIILVLYFRIYQVAKKRIQLKKQRYRCRIRRRPSCYRPRKSMCEIGKEVPSIATSATHRPSFNPSSVDEFQTTSSSGFYSSVTGTSSTTQGTTLSLDLKPTTHLTHPLQPLQSPTSKTGHGGPNNTHLSPLSLVLNTPEHRSSFDSVLSIPGNGGGSNSPPITSVASTGKRLSLEQFFFIQQQQQSIMCEQFVQACNTHTSSVGANSLYPQTCEKRHSATFVESPEHCVSNCGERKARKNSLFFRKRRESQTTPTNIGGGTKTLITTIDNSNSPSRSTSPNLIVYVDDYTSTACSSCFYDDEYDDDTIDEEDEDRRKLERRKSRIDFISGIPDIEEEAETNLEEEVVVIDDELNGGDYEIELIIDEDDLVSSIGHVNKSASANNLPVLPGVEAATSNRKCSNSAPEIVIIPDREGGTSIELDSNGDFYEMKESKPGVPSDIGPEMAAGIAAARRASRCMDGPCLIEIIHNTNAGRRKRSIVLRPPAGSAGGYDPKTSPHNNSSRRSSSGSQMGLNSSLPVALVQLASETASRTTTTTIKKTRKRPRVRIRKLRFRKGDEQAKQQTTTFSHNASGPPIRRAHRRHRDARHESKAAKTLTIITGIFIICWAPFFILALVMPLCSNCVIDKFLFDFCLWLGWANSSVNPLLYTIFSPDFRMAFKKLIFGSKRHKKKTRKYIL